ncbi:MAG: hypothetical protein KL863_03825 [Rhizobium sp.]|nr:hypothetical protein [Rhizobium sp.]
MAGGTMLITAIASRTTLAEKGIGMQMPEPAFEIATGVPQERRRAPLPDRIISRAAGDAISVASALARLPPAPGSAGNRERGSDIGGLEVADLAVPAGRRKLRSLDQAADCEGAIDAVLLQADLSDGGRSAMARLAKINAAKETLAKRALSCAHRHIVDSAQVDAADPRPRQATRSEGREPASVVIRFEAIVINVSFAGFGG